MKMMSDGGISTSKGCPQCGYIIDGSCEMCGVTLPKSQERVLLEELLEIVDEPTVGHDHTGAVNWLLEFANRVRDVIGAKPSE